MPRGLGSAELNRFRHRGHLWHRLHPLKNVLETSVKHCRLFKDYEGDVQTREKGKHAGVDTNSHPLRGQKSVHADI